jgi:hypothetical protein
MLLFFTAYIKVVLKCFLTLLYSVSENDSNDAFTSEICMVIMLLTLMGKN